MSDVDWQLGWIRSTSLKTWERRPAFIICGLDVFHTAQGIRKDEVLVSGYYHKRGWIHSMMMGSWISFQEHCEIWLKERLVDSLGAPLCNAPKNRKLWFVPWFVCFQWWGWSWFDFLDQHEILRDRDLRQCWWSSVLHSLVDTTIQNLSCGLSIQCLPIWWMVASDF